MTEQIKDDTCKRTEKWKIIKNVSAVSISYMFYYTAFGSASNLQSSLNAEAGLGTASLASVYTGNFLSNIFFSSLVLKWLGTKRTMYCCLLTYVPYILCQMYPKFYTLVPAGFILGLGSAPLWCAMCSYFSEASHAYSSLSKIPSEVILQRVFGSFLMTYQMGLFWGNLFSSLVLSIDNVASITSINATMIASKCGVNFEIGTNTSVALPEQPPEKVHMLTGVYIACMVVSILIIVFGLDSMKNYESCQENSAGKLSGVALLTATVKQLGNPDQLLFIAMNVYIGVEQAFIIADFTSSFVACAIGTGSVGYVMMTYGLSNAVGCFVNGYLAKLFGRPSLIICALLVTTGILLSMLLWNPRDYYVMLTIGLLWGLCDSVWMVQINAYFGVIFHGKEEAAYANFQLWAGVGCVFSFILSSYIRTRYKIYIILCNLIIGVTGYFILEYKYRSNRKIASKFEHVQNVDCQEAAKLNA